MASSTSVEPAIDWTEHFARYGFAVIAGLVDREFCDAALARARDITGNNQPLKDWTTQDTAVLHDPHFEGGTERDGVFDRLFEQPRLRAAIETLYGGPGHWNEQRNYYLFVKPYNPNAEPKLLPRGHIDFPDQGIPPLYRGFTFQVLLADAQPFSGNLTVHPATHKLVQKVVLDDSQVRSPGPVIDAIPQPPPFEFIGRAGDVCFVHHLIFHSGNESHAAGRTPRIALHAEAFRDEWLTEVDPSNPDLSPWQRSLALNGPVRTTRDLEHVNMSKRREYVEDLRKKQDAGPPTAS